MNHPKYSSYSSLAEKFIIPGTQFPDLLAHKGEFIYPLQDDSYVPFIVHQIDDWHLEVQLVGKQKVQVRIPTKFDGAGDKLQYTVHENGRTEISVHKQPVDMYNPINYILSKTMLPRHQFYKVTTGPVELYEGEQAWANIPVEFTYDSTTGHRFVNGGDIVIVYRYGPNKPFLQRIAGRHDDLPNAVIEWFSERMEPYLCQRSSAFRHLEPEARVEPVSEICRATSPSPDEDMYPIVTPIEAPKPKKAKTRKATAKPAATASPKKKAASKPVSRLLARTAPKFNGVNHSLAGQLAGLGLHNKNHEVASAAPPQ